MRAGVGSMPVDNIAPDKRQTKEIPRMEKQAARRARRALHAVGTRCAHTNPLARESPTTPTFLPSQTTVTLKASLDKAHHTPERLT